MDFESNRTKTVILFLFSYLLTLQNYNDIISSIMDRVLIIGKKKGITHGKNKSFGC